MPELPEVETTRRGIEPYIKGKILKQIIVREPKLRWPIPVASIQSAFNRKILTVERRGKYLLLKTSTGTIIIHLGMSGSLRICNIDETYNKHDHVDFIFSKKLLRYHDPRKFGSILWTTKPLTEHKLLRNLGPEPLQDEFNGEYLYKKSRKRTLNIKSFIMNSNIVTGIGNIYACESLYLSGINPKRKSGSLTRSRMHKLAASLKQVLAAAIKMGGTTLNDFKKVDGKPGYFSQKLLVYGREKEPCFNCDSIIKRINQNQRSTFYCNTCQH